MSVGSLCQVCESRPATRTCDRCGRLVCEAHFDESTGVCTACTAGHTAGVR